jgi:tryptophan halogenase
MAEIQNSFVPKKLHQVEVYLQGRNVFIRRNGETHKLQDVPEKQFLALWNAVDGISDISAIFNKGRSYFSNVEEVEILIKSLLGIAFDDPGHQRNLTKSIDAGETKLDGSTTGQIFENIHLNLDLEEEHKLKNILILGGGTAGYFTALALANQRPDLQVTLVESSKVPVIGVGEATTPVIVPFIHNVLGISPSEFYERVRPTWKLGIKFEWGRKQDQPFFNPFGINNLLETHAFNDSLAYATLGTTLMMSGKGLFTSDGQGVYQSLLDQVGYAYHLDNKQLIQFLKEKILDSDIQWMDRQVVDVQLAEDGSIESIVTDEEEHLEADLFIDCSGFRSILLERGVKSPFLSYKSSLFTDRAVTGKFSDGGEPAPYTLVQSMNHGWNWQVPVQGENHRGYVFSSEHCSDEEAQNEMHHLNPEIENFNIINFRCGRHREFWKKNVVAIGNAYGFVEPLESTGLHMIIESVQALIKNLPVSKQGENLTIKKYLNEKIGSQWDYIKWFLAIHFKFNEKKDTEFWKRCREETDISGVQDLIDLYEEVGPLTAIEEQDPEILRPFVFDRIFGTHGFDYMLMGQGIPFGNQFKISRASSSYPARKKHWKQITDKALSNQDALQFAYNHAHVLNEFII